MRKLILRDLADCPIPAESGLSPSALRRLLAEISSEVLNKKLGASPTEIEPEEGKKLADYADWLEGLALLVPEEDFLPGNMFYVASSIRELLASHTLGSMKVPQLRYLGTVLLAGASTHPSIGSVLGKRCADALENKGDPDPASACLAAIANLAGRELDKVIELQRYSDSLVAKLTIENTSISDLALISGFSLIAKSSADLAWAMFFGNEELAKYAVDSVKINISQKSDGLGGIGSIRWLARRWLAFADALWNRSSQQLLARAGFPTSYRRRLASDGIVELWPQQVRAIDSGFLGKENFVVALPTGSGKTLLAELSVEKDLRETEKGWACYLAPTRALVSQVQRELSPRLEAEGMRVRSILSGPEESNLLGQELDDLITPRSITITTPEKMESYYRFAPESFNGLKLLVVDEAQILGENSRGPIQEQIITRMLKRGSETRIVLLSAVVSNVEDLANWLGPETKSYYSSERLNRQIFAVAVRLPKLLEEEEYSRSGERRRNATYQGGLVTDFDLEEAVKEGLKKVSVGVTKAFDIRVGEKLQGEKWVEFREDTHSNDHSREMVSKFHTQGDSTLVFCAQRRIAVNQAKLLAQEVGELKPSANLQNLSKAIGHYLGPDHPLAAIVRSGIAYHHSLLPPTVQRLIEHGFKERSIITLFTTTTLREGINLPARNVIIASEQYFNEERGRSDDMEVSSFVNISGRAGRPHLDSIGTAILVPSKLSRAAYLGRKYFLYGPDALAVVSAMGRLITAIQQAGEPSDFEQFRPSDQALVLSLYASGIKEKEPLKRLLESTLIFSQMDFDSEEVSTFCTESFKWLESQVGEDRLNHLSKLGFGLEGSFSIERFVNDHREELLYPTGEVEFGSENAISLTKLCIGACRAVPELRNRSLKGEENWNSELVQACTIGWLSGESLPALASKYQKDLDAEESITHIVEITGDISQWFPWGIGAIHYALVSRGQIPDNVLPMLPIYMRFGVPSRIASLLSLIGVFDREVAISLAQKCDVEVPTLDNVEKWYGRIDPTELIENIPSFPIFNKTRSKVRLGSVQLAKPAYVLATGTPVVIRREGTDFVARLLNGSQIGDLGSKELMINRFGKSSTDLFGVVVNQKDRVTVLIAVLGLK